MKSNLKLNLNVFVPAKTFKVAPVMQSTTRVRAGAPGPLRPSGGYSGGDYLSSGDPEFAGWYLSYLLAC